MDISAVQKKIEALAAEVSPNAVTPTMVANIMTDLAGMIGETRSVMEVDVLRRDDGICLEFAILNNETGKQEVVNVVLPTAEPTMAGLMSAADKANADTLKTWYDAVSGKVSVTDVFYDAPTGGTDNVCLKVRAFGRTGVVMNHSVFLPPASTVRAGVMTAADKRRLDALDSGVGDGNPTIVDARIRFGATPFRIHGSGIFPTDEVRLYRCVKSVSKSTSDDKIKRPVKGWHRLTSFNRTTLNDNVTTLTQYRLVTHLQAPTDIAENSPWSEEVEVTVDVEKLDGGSWTAVDDGLDLRTFFAKHFLSYGVEGLYIQNGRKTKIIGSEYAGVADPSARTVDWALRVFRDGKPVTDMLPWKWLVEVKESLDCGDGVPLDFLDTDLLVSSIPLQTSAGLKKMESGGGETPSVELPDVNVVTSAYGYAATPTDQTLKLNTYNLKTGTVTNDSVGLRIHAATPKWAGIMTAEMCNMLTAMYKDYIQRKYQGQNVCVFKVEGYTPTTIYFNGKEYAKELDENGVCVLDLGDKKTINNTSANEKTFVKSIRQILFLPDGITNYDDAFNPGTQIPTSLEVLCDIDMSQCTSAIRMFFNQGRLTELDVSKWDVSKLADISYIFAQTGLKKLDVSNWDTSSLVKLVNPFSQSKISVIDTSKWKTPNLTCIHGLFFGVPIKVADVSSLDTSKVTDFSYMFNCWSARSPLQIIGLEKMNTSNGQKFAEMFGGLESLPIDFSTFDMRNATDVDSMIESNLESYQDIILGENFFDMPNITAFGLQYVTMSENLKQSLINCFDRKTAGQPTLTLTLPTRLNSGVTALTDEEKAAIEAKGYVLK